MLRFTRVLVAAFAAAAMVIPAKAHASAGFRFFTNRAAFLAALGNPPSTHQVDLNSTPTPTGSTPVAAIDGGQILVSTFNQTGSGATTAPEVLDPVAFGLPGSYGTDKLLSFTVLDLSSAPGDNAFGRVRLNLVPVGVTGFALEYGEIPSTAVYSRSVTAYDGGSSNFAVFTLPAPPVGGFAFVGVTVDPTAMNPPSYISEFDLAIGVDNDDVGRSVIRNIEYSSAAPVSAVPEPATVALVGLGLAAMGAGVRRRNQSRRI